MRILSVLLLIFLPIQAIPFVHDSLVRDLDSGPLVQAHIGADRLALRLATHYQDSRSEMIHNATAKVCESFRNAMQVEKDANEPEKGHDQQVFGVEKEPDWVVLKLQFDGAADAYVKDYIHHVFSFAPAPTFSVPTDASAVSDVLQSTCPNPSLLEQCFRTHSQTILDKLDSMYETQIDHELQKISKIVPEMWRNVKQGVERTLRQLEEGMRSKDNLNKKVNWMEVNSENVGLESVRKQARERDQGVLLELMDNWDKY
ncbi:uncharacterized protein VTP21DRAFT_7399 [Calcarisporiella thermophila]|uniref:uncharacterized protein n=1 Tax=Calcarisporiella thermophila TaxID=911321 RepID=UPI0037428C8A